MRGTVDLAIDGKNARSGATPAASDAAGHATWRTLCALRRSLVSLVVGVLFVVRVHLLDRLLDLFALILLVVALTPLLVFAIALLLAVAVTLAFAAVSPFFALAPLLVFVPALTLPAELAGLGVTGLIGLSPCLSKELLRGPVASFVGPPTLAALLFAPAAPVSRPVPWSLPSARVLGVAGLTLPSTLLSLLTLLRLALLALWVFGLSLRISLGRLLSRLPAALIRLLRIRLRPAGVPRLPVRLLRLLTVSL